MASASQAKSLSMSEASLISGLEKVIPGYVIESNPNLVNQLKNEILDNYVVIDKAEIVKKTFQTVSLKFPGVKRGDLITADLMNAIIGAIENLDERVTALESSSTTPAGPVITGFSYTGDKLHVGDRLTVEGRNFAVPAAGNIVMMGGTRITNFGMSSTDTRLVFVVPDIPGIPANGGPITVSVSNSMGSDSDTVTVHPALSIPQGRIEALYFAPPVVPDEDRNIRAGSYIFTFSVTTFVDLEANYTLTPTITGSDAWTAELLQDNVDQPRTSNLITFPGDVTGAQSQRFIRVRVTVPSHQPNGTVGTLSLAVTENTTGTNVIPGNAQAEITISSPPPTPESRVRVTLMAADFGAQIEGDKVRFQRNNPGRIRFNALFTVGGNYTVNAAFRNQTGWSEPEIDISQFDVTQPTTGETTNQSINLICTAGSSASATDLIFSVSGTTDAGEEISVRYIQGVTAAT